MAKPLNHSELKVGNVYLVKSNGDYHKDEKMFLLEDKKGKYFREVSTKRCWDYLGLETVYEAEDIIHHYKLANQEYYLVSRNIGDEEGVGELKYDEKRKLVYCSFCMGNFWYNPLAKTFHQLNLYDLVHRENEPTPTCSVEIVKIKIFKHRNMDSITLYTSKDIVLSYFEYEDKGKSFCEENFPGVPIEVIES